MKRALWNCLTGVGQVFLQENPVTGLLFIAGLLVSSPLMCLGGVFGVVIATLTAHLLKFPAKNISAGLYGFNATLVGIALPFFFAPSLTLFVLGMAGCIVSTLIMHWQLKKLPLPAYTSAFVVTTWALYAIAQALHLAPATHVSLTANMRDFGLLDGVGQVMFQENIFTGLLFLAGIFYNSRAHGLYALVGSIAGAAAAYLLQCPLPLIAAGIFSYNAVLCGIAMADKISLKQTLFPVVCSILSVFILLAFQKAGMPALTAPFVLASWLCVYAKGKTAL